MHHRCRANLDFVCNVEGVVVTPVREDNSIQGVGQAVCRGVFSTLKRVPEVCFRVFDFCMTTQNHETGNDDEDEKSGFDDADGVGQVIGELCMKY